MAKKGEKEEAKDLEAYTPPDLPTSYGELPPDGFFEKITFAYQAKQFMIGDAENGISKRELEFEPLLRHIIRRNYETPFGAEGAEPTCFSLDGKVGIHPPIQRVLGDGKEHTVYGECANCRFNQWNSNNLWQEPGRYDPNDRFSKSKNCAVYLMMLGIVDGEIFLIQIPSTGVDSCLKSISAAARSDKGVIFDDWTWKLWGTGGGYQGKYIKLAPGSQISQDRRIQLWEMRRNLLPTFRNSCEMIAQGGTGTGD